MTVPANNVRLEPGAALEQAVVNALRQTLLYRDTDCERMYDGQPPARMGLIFVAVWSAADRRAYEKSDRQSFGQRFNVNITLTARAVEPRDRWVKHRDEIATRANAIAALVQRDGQQRNICNAANALAELTYSAASQRPGGFHEGLKFLRYGEIEEKGGDWFCAAPGKHMAGFAQTIYFGDALRVQAVATAS